MSRAIDALKTNVKYLKETLADPIDRKRLLDKQVVLRDDGSTDYAATAKANRDFIAQNFRNIYTLDKFQEMANSTGNPISGVIVTAVASPYLLVREVLDLVTEPLGALVNAVQWGINSAKS